MAKLCDHMSLKEVARLVGLDWKTVKRIDKKYIQQTLTRLCDLSPTSIGVDEVAYEKGHKYLTIVRDVDTGHVIWVGEDRKQSTLDMFFQELDDEKSKRIKTVVMDMWDPYIACVQKRTGAEIVYDKFHVAKKVNEALDMVRKKEFKHASPEDWRDMKNKRFLILRREENVLDDKKETLAALLEKNETLTKAYLLKEQLLHILDESDQQLAEQRLITWKKNVLDSGLEEFEKLLKTLEHSMYGILNYFKHHLTNAGSEGFNNKINLIKKKSLRLPRHRILQTKNLKNMRPITHIPNLEKNHK